MAKKKVAVEAEVLPSSAEAVSDTNGNGKVNGTADHGDKRQPCYKCGPIPTDANNTVEAVVWPNQATARDGRTFVVYNVTCQANWRDAFPTRSLQRMYCFQ